MAVINVPLIGPVNFPDSMSEEEIVNAIENDLYRGLNREYGAGETAVMGLERGVTASARTLAGPASTEVTPGYEDPLMEMQATVERTGETDADKELKFRLAREQNKIAGYGGQVLGSIADPAGWAIGAPLGAAKTVGQLAYQGAVGGFGGGLLEPVYEELGDSRLSNVVAGTIGGGVLAGGIGLAGKKWLFPETKAKVEADDAGTVKTEADLPTAAVEPEIKTPIQANPVETAAEDEFVIPTIPQDLGAPKPRFGKAEIVWNNDIDNLLYTVGNPSTKSKRHDQFVSYLQEALKLPKDQVLSLAKEVRNEVIQKGKEVFKDAALKGKKEVGAFSFDMSKALDNVLYPVTRNLNEFDTFAYNLGKTLPVDEQIGKVRVNPNSPNIQQLLTKMKQVNPGYTGEDAAAAAKGYSLMLDKMKADLGRGFKPRAFEDMLVKKMDEDTALKLFGEGVFDGCP